MAGIEADAIIFNGTIWCGFEEGTAEALAIWQGKVLAVGTKDDIWPLKGAGTRLIDLEGRFATPGLNDAHLHLISIGLTMGWLDVTPQAAPTLESLLSAIRQKAASAPPGTEPTPFDQRLGTGDGATATFQLVKRYGGDHAPYARAIAKPVAGSVRVAVGSVEAAAGHVAVDHATGRVTFAAGHIPAAGAIVTAGFRFDVPVRFDTDTLTINLAAFEAGEIPSIPLVEIRP